MKKFMIILSCAGLLAACDTPDQSALLGAAAGAAIGSETSGKNKDKGALIGAIAGAAAGAALGGTQQAPQCRYRYPDGTEYVADCPQ